MGHTVYVAPPGSTDSGEWVELGELTQGSLEVLGSRRTYDLRVVRHVHADLLREVQEEREVEDIAREVPGACGW